MPFPELTPDETENILQHNWWGHDGRWYLSAVGELGFEKANEMNMAVNKAVGKLEMKNLMLITGVNRESLRSDILRVLRKNLNLCASHVFSIKEFAEEGGDFILRIDGCPAHSGTEKAGYSSEYQCACFKRAEGWLDELGMEGTTVIRKSLVRGDPFCEIVLTPGE